MLTNITLCKVAKGDFCETTIGYTVKANGELFQVAAPCLTEPD